MAWVSVPWLSVTPSRQRYSHLRRGAAEPERAEGAGLESMIRLQSGDFSADVSFDAQGLFVDYPWIGRIALPCDLELGDTDCARASCSCCGLDTSRSLTPT